MQIRADDAEFADNIGAPVSHLGFAGHIIEFDPAALRACDHALGAQDHAEEFLLFEPVQHPADLIRGVLHRGLHAPAREDLIGIMIMVVMMVLMLLMIVVMVVMIMVMVMMLMLLVIVIMVVMIMVMVMVLMLLVIVVMVVMIMVMVMVLMLLMIVVMVVMIMVMMMVLMLLVIVVVFLMIMVMVGAVHDHSLLIGFGRGALVMVMVVMMLLAGCHHFCQQLRLQIVVALKGIEDLFAGKLRKRRCDDRGPGIV